MRSLIFSAGGLFLGVTLLAAGQPESVGEGEAGKSELKFTADRIAVDMNTHATHATGHVHAVSHPVSMRSESLVRRADGTLLFADPTCVTTCTNEVGHTHWNVTGELEYHDRDCVILRNVWLHFYELPVFYLPYFYYPLETDCGFSWMPGYMGHWGAYLLTKYSYHLLGDPAHSEQAPWLAAATRFDLRERQGLAFGEDVNWGLGRFGEGKFRVYYAWDQEAKDQSWNNAYGKQWDRDFWGSDLEEHRYGFSFEHQLDLTERDRVRVQGSYFSDSYFQSDFLRRTLFNAKSQWLGHNGNGVFWEHLENAFAVGAEVSGRLNDFYGSTSRLPEFYLDVHPQPLWGLPVNYESENRIGYLKRDPAVNGNGNIFSAYAYNPGRWADYDAFRLDTYHRLTLPFRTFDEVVAVVPRIGYRGTFWSQSGQTDRSDGWDCAYDAAAVQRSILEGGVTFAARGSAWVNERWRHLTEPYLDVLAQQAYWGGTGDNNRPYVFDNLDATQMWEDQFAGRGRSLPYTYYGVTPGWRNAWSQVDGRGRLGRVVDLDIYAALQFNPASYTLANEHHRLPDRDCSPYAEQDCSFAPGARLRWQPSDDLMLMARCEYDADNNRLAVADFGFKQVVSKDFQYNVRYVMRDYRYWDFASAPFSPEQMQSDDFNDVKCHNLLIECTQQPLDWFAWSPFVRWDFRDNSLDCVGAWFDYLTDCLGFRLTVQYENEYTMINGYSHDEDWTIGFFIYLRAFGPAASSIFTD